jgi:hypothetical protein
VSEYECTEHLLDEIQRLREANYQLRDGAEEQKQRIKRLEEGGELALGYASKGDFESADEVWRKAKEAKP